MKLISHFQNLTPYGDARWIFETPETLDATESYAGAGEVAETQTQTKTALDKLSFIEGMEYAAVGAEALSELTVADMEMIETVLEREFERVGVNSDAAEKMVKAWHSMFEWAKTPGTKYTEDELYKKFVEESLAAGVPQSEIEKINVDLGKEEENEAADSTKNERNTAQVSFKVGDVFGSMSTADRATITSCENVEDMRTTMGNLYKEKFAAWMESISNDISAQLRSNDAEEAKLAAATIGGQGAAISKIQGGAMAVTGMFKKNKNLGDFPPNSDLGHLFSGVEIQGIAAGSFFSQEIAKYLDETGGTDIESLQNTANKQIDEQINEMIKGEAEFDAIKTKFSPMESIESGKRTVEEQRLLVAKLKTVTDFLVGTKYEEEYKEFVEGGGSWNFDRWMEGRKEKMGGMEKLGLLFKQIGYWFKTLKGSITGSESEEKKSALVAEMEGMIKEGANGNDLISADEVLDQENWCINEESLLKKFDEDHLTARMIKKAVLPEKLKSGPAAEALHSMLGHDESFFIAHSITTEDLEVFAAEYGKSFGDDSKDVFHSNPETEGKPGDYFSRGNETDPTQVKDLPDGTSYFEVEGTGGRFERDYAFADAGAFFTWLKRQNNKN